MKSTVEWLERHYGQNLVFYSEYVKSYWKARLREGNRFMLALSR